MELINLTPHDLHFLAEDGQEILTVPPSGTVARCAEERHSAGRPIAGVPCVWKSFGAIEGLPEPTDGTVYITSALAAQAAWAEGRDDVACVADPVRDSEGRIIGARSLAIRPEYGQARAAERRARGRRKSF